MPTLMERPPNVPPGSRQQIKHRSVMRRHYKAALTLLTLLALLGKGLQADSQAVEAVVQVVKHLHLFGF